MWSASPFSPRPFTLHLALGVGFCVLVGWSVHLGLKLSQRGWVEEVASKLAEVSARLEAKRPSPHAAALSGADGVSGTSWWTPSHWPGRAALDQVTQVMSEQAILNGLALRTLSVSHSEPTAQAWGRVSLEVAVSGAYAGVKNWQSGLQARFPSLAVQSLRIQLVSNTPTGGVEAQWVWVLYVRD